MYDIPREREAAIRRHVRWRVLRRVSLLMNFALLAVFTMLVAGRPQSDAIPVIGSLWILALVAHAIVVFTLEWLDRAVTQELERERMAYYRAIAEPILTDLSYEKRKRVDHLMIGDDDERVDYDEDYSERRRKRG